MAPGPPAPDSEEQDEADRLEGRPAPAGSASSGTSRIWDAPVVAPRPPPGAKPPGSSSPALTRRKPTVGGDVADGSSDAPSHAPRGTAPKPKSAEASTQADSDPHDWTSFDLGRSLSLLHSANEAVVRRTLRRLHIRLWHNGVAKMSNLLKHAGAPTTAIKLLPEIVDTCRICRMWKRPTPKSVTTTRLAEKFNEAVQWGILFYKKAMLSHLLDEAVRWYAV